MICNHISFTAIIPTRNRPADLLQAVESILVQTRLPEELIIIDQSGDETSKTSIEKLFLQQQRCTRLVYVHDSSIAGLVAAKEHGTSKSTGEIVCFLEDDVILDRNYLENIEKAFLNNKKMMGCCGVVKTVTTSGFLYRFFFRLFHTGIFKDPRVETYGLSRKINGALIPSTFLSGGLSAYRREVFQMIPFLPENGFFMLEDIVFSTHAAHFFGADRFYINITAQLEHKLSPLNRAKVNPRYERKFQEYVCFYRLYAKEKFAFIQTVWLFVGLFLEASLMSMKLLDLGPLLHSLKGIKNGLNAPLKPYLMHSSRNEK